MVTLNAASEERVMLYRYEHPDDRFIFWRWIEAQGPGNKRPYWYFNGEKNTLILELQKGDRRMAYALTKNAMNSSVLGWRSVVAQSLRQVRRALRADVKVTGASSAGDEGEKNEQTDTLCRTDGKVAVSPVPIFEGK